MLRQQPRVLGMALGCPRLLLPPVIGSAVVVGDAILEQRAKLLSRKRQLQSIDHRLLSFRDEAGRDGGNARGTPGRKESKFRGNRFVRGVEYADSTRRTWCAVRRKGRPKAALRICGRSERTSPTSYCFGSSILICASGSVFPTSAAAPVGKLSLLRRKATMSAACSGESVPGAVAGIVVCVFS